jgi:type I restriction enzyme S subunit
MTIEGEGIAFGGEFRWPQHILDLFPDRLVQSELGEIPEGWEVGTLGDLAEVTSGKRPDEKFESPTCDASVPLWGGNGPMAYVRQPLFTEPILLTGRVGTLGSVFRISSPCWPSDNTLVVVPRKRLYMEYLYFCMKGFDFDSLNRGSTQPILTQTDLKKPPLLIASGDMLSEFHMIASDLFARVDAITRESRTLAALRDALLPKLISGELRVKDAERFLEERGLC